MRSAMQDERAYTLLAATPSNQSERRPEAWGPERRTRVLAVEWRGVCPLWLSSRCAFPVGWRTPQERRQADAGQARVLCQQPPQQNCPCDSGSLGGAKGALGSYSTGPSLLSRY